MSDFVLYIPSYNDSPAVRESLDSSPDWRVVISDNASNAQHAAALAAMASDRVTVVRQPTSLGRMGNTRWCVEHFRDSHDGPQWMRMLMAGDRHVSGALAYLRQMVGELPEARVMVHQMRFVSDDGDRLWQPVKELTAMPAADVLYTAALYGNVFQGSSAISIHRDALQGGVDFAEGVLSYCSDFYFALTLARRYPIYYLPHVAAEMVTAYRKTLLAKIGSLEAIAEQMLIRHRAAEWFRDLSGDEEKFRELERQITFWAGAALWQLASNKT